MTAMQAAVEKIKQLVGLPLKRVEDPKLLTGTGRYVDDIHLPRMLVAAFVRSPHAHAKINRVDASKALKRPGVVAVFNGMDMKGIQNMETIEAGGQRNPSPWPVLATAEANYMGEAIAVVIAEDAYLAEDGAEAVDVEYDPLPAVKDVLEALKPDSTKVHDYLPNNVSSRDVHETGDVKKAFEEADEVVRVALLNQRVAVVPMEPRGILASYDVGSGLLTIYSSTQDPHGLRDGIARFLGISSETVRVIAPDVGGGFGGKTSIMPEDVVVSLASTRLRRPVKWVESRRENIMAMSHGRGQKQYAELAVRRDGKILGLRTRIISDTGAYATPTAVELPGLTYLMGTGTYDIPAYAAEIITVFTNKVPLGAYRGAGRPEAAYLVERCMNIVARKLKLDPVRIRQANYIPREAFPFRTRSGITYDSGDYNANLRKALEVSNYDRLRAEQRAAREEGRLFGLGICTWVEIAGFGPTSGQSAAISVNPQGEVLVAFGGQPQGQGHSTTFSQLVADTLGVEMSKIKTTHGDTGVLPWGTMTAGSRSGPVTGSAVRMAAMKVRHKMERIAAFMLKLPEGTKMTFADGLVYPEGNPGEGVEFAKVAATTYNPPLLPPGMEATIFEYAVFTPPNNGFPFGTHVAAVEVEKETGVIKLLKYFAVDDCGTVINPLVVEGQVQGGIIQGLGQAMLEQVIYDENGQLITSTLSDYAIPSAEIFPNITWDRTVTPTPVNPMGVKGIGEAGTIASTPTFVNAVEDALSPYDVTIDMMPLRPDYIKSLIGGTHKPMVEQDLQKPIIQWKANAAKGNVDVSVAVL